jgi:hypothetical protein
MIVNDDRKWRYKLELYSRVINYAPRIVNWPSIMLQESIYRVGVTHDDRHLRSSYFYSANHWLSTLDQGENRWQHKLTQ